ncbi:hypothetical protein BDV12DRAFT_178435, partial [Aspergillus spectabilis]
MANLAYIMYSQGHIHNAIALMGNCVRLHDRVLGSSHPHTTYCARSLMEWKQKIHSLTNKQHRPPVQAASDRPEGIPQDICYPAVVTTQPDSIECMAFNQGPEPSRTSLKMFLETHPLLKAARNSFPVLRGHELNEV